MNATLSNAELDKILATLANLKALRDDAGTPGEAEAAAAGIARLLFKHNLDMADIRDKGEATVESDKYVRDEFTFTTKINGGDWKLKLFSVIAQNNFCRIAFYPKTDRSLIIGQPANIAVVKGLHVYLVEQIKRLTMKYYRVAFPTDSLATTASRSQWRKSFRLGIVVGINARLQSERVDNVADAGSRGTALVVQSEAALDEAYGDLVGNVRKGRKSGASQNWDAFGAGRAAASHVSLAKREPLRPAAGMIA